MKLKHNFFGDDIQFKTIDQIGDPLVKLNRNIDWEIFRTPIETNMHKDRSKGGRPPYDAILMFKIVTLQQLYGLSDLSTQFEINNRHNFMRFLGLNQDIVPDCNTIWVFKEALKKTTLIVHCLICSIKY
ncbi:MAG: transposase [Christensenellaceae bacterium]|nr:transposase [Christensenellaceae bacterium]